MAEYATTLTMIIAVLGLLVGALGCVMGYRQASAGASQVQVTHNTLRLNELESLHRARLDVLESDCRRLRNESTQALAHASLCEQELARLGRLFQQREGNPLT